MTRKIYTTLFASVMCLLCTFQSKAQQDCNAANITMSCNNLVNLSVGQLCTKTIVPEDILTSSYTCYDKFTVTILNTSLGNTVGYAQIGKTLDVSVKHTISGNSCWGKIKVEDKLAPVIICTPTNLVISCATPDLGVSLSEKVVFDNIPNNGITDVNISVYGKPLVTENCSGYTLSYSDDLTDTDCTTTGVSAVLVRTWKAKDLFNNISTCSITYTLERKPITAVIMPSDVTFECSDLIKKDAKGNPHPDDTGAPTINGLHAYPGMAGLCEVSSSYQDTKIATCGKTYKVTRKWTVIDWCSNQIRQHTQVIHILDTQAPTFTTPVDATISTSANVCMREWYAPKVLGIADNCDAAPKVFFTVYEFGGPWAITSGDTLRKINVGEYTLETKVTDACGNSTIKTSKLTIKDLIEPSAVCDLNTKVDVTIDGSALVNASTFDDGSTDNCCIDANAFEVKRMTESDASFAKTINFNCGDGKLQVIMRVFDCYGNSNTCMVNVTVEDKLPPMFFTENGIAACGNQVSPKNWLDAHQPKQKTLVDLPSPTNPGYYDNCGVTPTIKEDKNNIDNCGNGTYTRSWIATDAAGNKVEKTQTVVSENRSAYKVTFPKDVTLICTDNGTLDTSVKTNGAPVIEHLGNTCALIGVKSDDQIFKLSNDGCYKILRRWKVLNWCDNDNADNPDRGTPFVPVLANGACGVEQSHVFVNISTKTQADVAFTALLDAHDCFSYDEDGYMEFTQVIKVVDYDAPVIGNIDIEIEDNAAKDCNGGAKLNIKKVTTVDCSDVIVVTFKSNIPGLATGSVPAKLDNAPYGKYKMTIEATDNCGNFSSKEIDIEIKEQKKPTPVCKHNIAVEMMQTGTVMVNAKVLDGGSYDNCTAQNKLKYRIQFPAPGAGVQYDANKTDTMYTFSCSNITATGYVAVALWVGDEAGNWDYCETVIHLQDNMTACVNNIPNQMKKIAGVIQNATQEPVEGVSLLLDGAVSKITTTNLQGQFKFDGLLSNKNYDLTPSKNTMPLNGVSTLDIVLMSKHILGIQTFTNMYQPLAADINSSGSVTTADVVELRKVILGLQSTFSKNTSWRFIEKGQNQDVANTAWIKDLPVKKSFLALNSDPLADFVAVKVGDINGSAKVNSAQGEATNRNDAKVLFEVDKNAMQNSEIATVYFTCTEKNIEGYQFTLNYDKNNLELMDIQGDKDNFGVLEAGIVTTSWNGAATENQTFGLTFRAKKASDLTKTLQFTSQVLANEVYNNEGDTKQAVLTFDNKAVANFELYQNQPNPFNGSTTVSFQLPDSQSATLSVSDMTGRVVRVIKGDFNKGLNEITLDKSIIGVAGMWYYTLKTSTNAATKKMIIVE